MMRGSTRLKVISLLIFICALACGGGERASRKARRGDAGRDLTMVYAGLKRSYRLYVPDSLDGEPAALVVVLHGGGGDAERMERYTGFNRVAQREGFVVVYPQGVDKSWNDGRDDPQIEAQRKQIDDVGFIAALIDVVAAQANIDRRRVYVTGISNGAMMSYRLLCERAELFVGVATAIGAMPALIGEGCEPSRATPLFNLMGTKDELVPYEGGQVRVFGQERGEVWSAKQTIAHFVSQYGCVEAPSSTSTLDVEPDDGVHIELERYGGGQCPSQVHVVHARVVGGGHTWPGGSAYAPEFVVGATSQDVDATELFWEFFSQSVASAPK